MVSAIDWGKSILMIYKAIKLMNKLLHVPFLLYFGMLITAGRKVYHKKIAALRS